MHLAFDQAATLPINPPISSTLCRNPRRPEQTSRSQLPKKYQTHRTSLIMCRLSREVCASCGRIINYVILNGCPETTRAPCVNPTLTHPEFSSLPCHYCSLSTWRWLNKNCRLLHNMKCRQCGRQNSKLAHFHRLLQDATSNLSGLGEEEEKKLRVIRSILAEEVVLDQDELRGLSPRDDTSLEEQQRVLPELYFGSESFETSCSQAVEDVLRYE
ncbi:hypothetical protein B0J12DRAFT_268869 [Macrophomina phaseolina]|uniref:Uncharacterized protein n=1 Tax=Macrophomina phaseolina TaxID=35725 RepID=A0ABQ8FY82_9PEZI|nr:hypothetical protein B0J12DRAFT_268869 [Macrophomina phaseolina]